MSAGLLKWWQSAVFYQIYPRSFADGNGDGIGDFAGMTARLDHLRELGIDAVWLSPHFPSPFIDCGYDVSDFCGVGSEYGTLDDFRTFLAGAHARGIRVVLDLVLNHSSHRHPWFIESSASRDNPKRDWYVWHDPAPDGGPPNNWLSIFGGPAWTLDERTGQYYYHAFLKEQPDLNWRNPALKEAMWQAVRFWLDMGVDGFRLDAIGTVYEDPALAPRKGAVTPDEVTNPSVHGFERFVEIMGRQFRQPGVHELMQELRALVDTYPGDRVLLGEDDDVSFHGDGDNELHLVFNFPLMRPPRLTPVLIRANQAERLAALPPGAWPCNTLGNHDGRRLWSRFGDGVHDAALARLHLALMATLRGTPVLYNGEEIGMRDLVLTELGQFRDTAALSAYRLLTGAQGKTHEQALAAITVTTRDRCRGPLQWSGEAPNAGFSPPGTAPWLPVNADFADGVNVADQAADPCSLLNFYRRLLALRRATPALVAGDYQALDEDNPEVLAFLRRDPVNGQTCLVALNFSAEAQTCQTGLDAGRVDAVRLLFSSSSRDGCSGAATAALGGALPALALAPHEVFIAELG